ncbi:carboxypeptidase regulatory-like domain-containing protein [bacterium]|nr:carboxypeptidase regulatory-like domain-containing protein [bacterium]
MRKLFSIMVGLTLVAFLFGCGGGGGDTGQTAKTPAKTVPAMSGYSAMAVTDGGSITGKVSFAGPAPKRQKLEVTKDINVCGKVDHYSQDIVVSSDMGLANVVVSLANISKGKGMDALGTTFELDQKGCTFLPHITVLPAGAECTILNSDGVLHNIHTYSEKNKPVNVAQPGFKKRMTQTFSEPETIRVACDVHNWMGGYIVVIGHPYYAVTDASGNFELSDVPAGTYTVEYWQEKLGKQTAEITVTAGAAAEANLEYTMGSN